MLIICKSNNLYALIKILIGLSFQSYLCRHLHINATAINSLDSNLHSSPRGYCFYQYRRLERTVKLRATERVLQIRRQRGIPLKLPQDSIAVEDIKI